MWRPLGRRLGLAKDTKPLQIWIETDGYMENVGLIFAVAE
jgi:hypothetical protein